MRWTIGRKLATSFSGVILLMLLAAGLSFRALLIQQ